MGLIDDARAARALPGPVCAVQRTLRDHPDHADDLRQLIADRSIENSRIEKACLLNGLDEITRHTLQRHRANLCGNCRALGVVW